MKAEDMCLEEIINFNDGKLDLYGRRLIIHDMRAFAQFRKDLIDMVGLEDAKRILIRFGYFWGQADASAMKRLYTWDNLEEWIKAGSQLYSIQGVVKSIIKSLKVNQNEKLFFMEIIWNDSAEASEHIAESGYSDRNVCWIMCGYMSGYVSFCFGQNVYFIEKQCAGKKDPACFVVGKDVHSWQNEINQDLPYYQFEEIKGKILSYAEELKKMTAQLEEQRKKIRLLQNPSKPFIIEIHSPAFKHVMNVAGRAANFDTSVLITGETGVGKEVLAKYIHKISARKDRLFLAINCGALPETLAESELFGYKAGAFTGAVGDHIGLIEKAKGGTLLLDEIGDISMNLQLKILRVLQEKEIFRIGENTPRKIDVRIIAATNKDLKTRIEQNVFREDLYYRLKVIEIMIPPLRERKEDIITLVRYFIHYFSVKLKLPKLKIHASCYQYLEHYPWPGNIRELENVIERAAVLSENNLILPEHLPDEITGKHQEKGRQNFNQTLEALEINYINDVLKRVNGNKVKACKILGISQSTLWRKLKEST